MKCDVCDVEGVKMLFFKEHNVHLCLRCSRRDRGYLVAYMIEKSGRALAKAKMCSTVPVSEQKRQFMYYLGKS